MALTNKSMKLIAFLFLFACIIYASSEHVISLVNRNGIVTSESYRGITIGKTKEETVLYMYNSNTQSNLKIIACRNPGDEILFVFDKYSPCSPWVSDMWVVSYPGVHKEKLLIYFRDNRVHRVEYARNIFSP